MVAHLYCKKPFHDMNGADEVRGQLKLYKIFFCLKKRLV